jgi:N-formylglutamate deformylase
MEVFRFVQGRTPLLVSMPHDGTYIPADLAADMTEAGLNVPDTDWHVSRLYDFLGELEASVIRATHSRYVIDLNRSPSGAALYAGQRNTELCPVTCFDDRPIYKPGRAPDASAIALRIERFWRPYHDRLAGTLAELKARHGYALLFDAHSIRSRVPRFFEGRLWDLNLGTGDGLAASPGVSEAVTQEAAKANGYSSVLNGRFKGGYITRTYGRPTERVEAVQLELAQATYMDEDPPFAFREDLAAGLRPVLSRILAAMQSAGAKRYRGAEADRKAL